MSPIPDEDLDPALNVLKTLRNGINDVEQAVLSMEETSSDTRAELGRVIAAMGDVSTAAAAAAEAARTAEADVSTAANAASAAAAAASDASTLAGSAVNNARGAADAAERARSAVATLGETVGLLTERIVLVESRTSAAGGYGPNYVATASTPAEVRRAIAAAGGFVGNGVNDHAGIIATSAKYAETVIVHGQYGMGGVFSPLARRRVVGWGTGTELVAAKGLSGAMIRVNTDHVHLSQLAMVGSAGRATTEGEAAGTDHLVVDNTTKDGFWTGSESTFFGDNLVSKNSRGRGIVWSGSFNRDSKISQCHIYNPTGDGFYVAVVDGMISMITVGTPGGYGFNFTNKCANLEVEMLKAWFCEQDGFYLDPIRCNFSHLQAQDCRKAGIRLLGDGQNSLHQSTADSNSWITGGANRGIHCGLEIGLNAATVAGTPGSRAQYKGNDWTVIGFEGYDKREGGADGARQYNQRHGILVAAGVTDLDLAHVKTGRTTMVHRNLVDGVVFTDQVTKGAGSTWANGTITSATRSHESNSFTAVRSHGMLV